VNRYFLDPFGCVKNQVDAENMMAHLNKAGWENTSDAEAADLIIINSCGFIESAKQESINAVLEWRKLYPSKKILLAGCLTQRYAKELPQELTEADGFMGVGNPAQITNAASKLISTRETPHSVTGDEESSEKIENAKKASSIELPNGERPLLSLPGSAYVKISEGCNNCCSYCAIPLIRGSLVSRTIPDIVEECRILLKRGIVELNIIGQDIGAFGMDSPAQEPTQKREKESKLPELLNAISVLEGHFWVRLLYIHPNHFPLKILDIMERDHRFLPYFDIPFQHASTKILTAMKRSQNNAAKESHAETQEHGESPAEKYLTLLKTIRTRLPNAVIRSTFLLGFPGETEEDFAELLDFQKKANMDWLGCFVYSREEGTEAYPMKGRIPSKTAVMRKQIIEERQIVITEKNMERFVGQHTEVLIEEQFTEDAAAAKDPNPACGESFWLGRLYCQAPDIDGATVIISGSKNQPDDLFGTYPGEENPQVGTFAKCRVAARHGFDLEARI
jgi:ribosomal protein S12 methylthiotransferase